MTLTMFECFMEAVKTLNFTAAAQNIHMTQPAFSRNIAAMEDELGFSLFLRSKQSGLRVTPAGLAMYNGLVKLNIEYGMLRDQAARINRGEEGELVIGILNGMCLDSKTMETVHRFQERYPQVDIKLISYPLKRLLQSVENGESDMCFSVCGAVEGRDNLLHEDVFEIENYLIVPASLHCDSKKMYSLKDFREQYFLLSEDSPELNHLLIEKCREAGFEPKTKMAPDYDTKMLWVEIGKGIGINSKEHFMKNSPYVDFVKVKEIRMDGYSMIWQKDNYNPAIAIFYSMFEES
ncbi:LysR family transcriptional regulator [uncultured Eubacterium sp.]|uniref:LysR family transcriptional regulator n=1 Tax=uncultured Eubacterium sp. TaxID=165185 RepID=UPI0025973648|nr:LysR family transcriptional regulator [uncultured Eubacterium sp.]